MDSKISCDYFVNATGYDAIEENRAQCLTDNVVDELCNIRRQRGLTQQDIADATGIKRANVARIEGKHHAPSLDSLMRYAECLGLKLKLGIQKEDAAMAVRAGTVGIGVQSFPDLREQNLFYIDKTGFIKEWWESGAHTTLIARPRRFGKTLNMSMLESFFSVKYAGRGDLFEGLLIWEEEKYQKLQGTYPVISLSFANVKDNDYKTVSFRIRQIISNLYEEYAYLLQSDKLSEAEKAYFERVVYNLTEEEAPMAINRLSKFLSSHFGKKVLIFLDEYDTPMHEAYVRDFWPELADFTRVFFNCTFKTNPYLKKAIMTGITRVSKESFFSDLNHLNVVTVTSEQYTTAFGFTPLEVFWSLLKFGKENEMENVKRWYDGFLFGEATELYNPWSILNFLQKGKLETYWTNTSSNELASKLVREGGVRMKDTFERLLKGEEIVCRLDEQINFEQLSGNDAAVLSLFLASGYIKSIWCEPLDGRESIGGPERKLVLTNYEVKRTFRNMVHSWFEPAQEDYPAFINALLSGDLEQMNYHMSRLTMQLFSYFDTGKGLFGAEPERFYHGFMLGLLVELEHRYIITSNRESGFGRYDVVLEPRNPEDTAILLEFKVHQQEKEADLMATVTAALKQIEEKQYEQGLLAKGIDPEHIRSYGFAFEGKKVLIGEKTR